MYSASAFARFLQPSFVSPVSWWTLNLLMSPEYKASTGEFLHSETDVEENAVAQVTGVADTTWLMVATPPRI